MKALFLQLAAQLIPALAQFAVDYFTKKKQEAIEKKDTVAIMKYARHISKVIGE